ncbi:fungal-specific transcription factor domain-containing protein [Xylariaceae sp. FL1272]|nr:fungal-specific transcription factor domain-containing protein [Xylariaceae sp. FL1272]
MAAVPSHSLLNKKTKTKTFTGCWTCRRRKVKCDLGRPSCSRCSKAHLQCEGYNIPLYWISEQDDVCPSFIRRQARSLILGNPHWPAGTLKDIDQHIQDVDDFIHNPGIKARISGPFSVFQGQTETNTNACTYSSMTTLTPRSDAQVEGNAIRSGAAIISSDSYAFDGGRDSWDTLPRISTSSETSISLSIPTKHQIHMLVPDIFMSSKTPGLTPISKFLNRSASQTQMINNFMDHYRHSVASILQPVRHCHNAYRSFYATRAMETSEVGSRDNSVELKVSSISQRALLYSLLASAGFHLRSLHRSQNLDDLARHFRTRAYSYLKEALGSLSSVNRQEFPYVQRPLVMWEGVLSVTLTLVTADILDGSMSEFWIHLDAAKDLVEHLRRRDLLSPPAQHLVNISSFLRILSDSTHPHCELEPWPPSRGDENIFLADGHTLEFTYGVTVTLADFIRRVCLFARHVAWYNFTNHPQPEEFRLACDGLLQAICDWQISDEPLHSFSDSDDVTVLLVSKHLQAFATSIRIFYHTRVSACDNVTMQALVQVVALHLTEIEEIKEQTGYNDIQSASIAWPGFIASCQTDRAHRAIWTKWWSSMLTYNIGNINNLWSVVQDTWAIQDEGAVGQPPWAAVLRRDHKRILAI